MCDDMEGYRWARQLDADACDHTMMQLCVDMDGHSCVRTWEETIFAYIGLKKYARTWYCWNYGGDYFEL